MTRNRNVQRWLTYSTALFLVSSPLSWAQTEEAPESAAENEALSSPAPEVFEAMGFAMAQSLRLNIDFSEEELDRIFSGMRSFAQGDTSPPAMSASIQEAQAYYLQKLQVAREREESERAAAAERNREATEQFFADLDERENVQKTESGLYYEVLEEGAGDRITVGKTVTLNYTGSLPSGEQFDAGQGAEFPIQESGGLIEGFRQGLLLGQVGTQLRLYIPPELGYGNAPPPGSAIEPGQPLIFEVEVLGMQEVRRRQALQGGPPGGPPGAPPAGRPTSRPPTGAPPGPPPGPPPNIVPPPPPSTPPPPPPSRPGN